MDRYTTSTRDITDDLITRYRSTATRETHCHIVHTFDHDTTFGMLMALTSARCIDLIDDLLLCNLLRFFLLIFLKQAIDDLPFL